MIFADSTNMPEPSSTAAAGVGAWKLAGGAAGIAGAGVGAALLVVLAMRLPKSPREWIVALVSTVMSSITLGSAGIVYFGLAEYLVNARNGAEMFFVACGLSGFVFTCGLPGWLFVRLVFRWIEARWNAKPEDVVADVRGLLKR